MPFCKGILGREKIYKPKFAKLSLGIDFNYYISQQFKSSIVSHSKNELVIVIKCIVIKCTTDPGFDSASSKNPVHIDTQDA